MWNGHVNRNENGKVIHSLRSTGSTSKFHTHANIWNMLRQTYTYTNLFIVIACANYLFSYSMCCETECKMNGFTWILGICLVYIFVYWIKPTCYASCQNSAINSELSVPIYFLFVHRLWLNLSYLLLYETEQPTYLYFVFMEICGSLISRNENAVLVFVVSRLLMNPCAVSNTLPHMCRLYFLFN